ncbi:MAG TPA: diguanylate cyclase [Solirubrobacteraceae bacterium]|jgi:diguanylate cyclase (GGDEF)-like protein|nr:diguanylate cyclase [Solirubrobacteraceae bacterium]
MSSRLVSYLSSDPVTRRDAFSAHDRGLMARIAVRLFLGGAVLTLAVLLLPHGHVKTAGMLAVCAGCVLGAVVMHRTAGRMPYWSFDVIAAYATLLITGARVFANTAGDSGTGIQALYVWVVLFVFYFLPRSHALLQLAWIGALYGLALDQARPTNDATITVWAVTMVGLLLAGLVVARMRDRTDELVERLGQAARTDALTGLLNRRAFDERLEQEIARAERTQRPFAVLLGDLDRFKEINDRYGHPAGDATLILVGQVLRGATRSVDTVARVGGDEFAILLPESDEQQGWVLVERLRRYLRDALIDHDPAVGLSIGLVVHPGDGDTAEALRASVDKALYAAKEAGTSRPTAHPSPAAETVNAAGATGRAETPELAAMLNLVRTLDARGVGSPEHSRRVAHLAGIAARQLGLPPAKVQRIELAGSLHDIGTVGVPEVILSKRGPLTPEERSAMRRHPEIGADILGSAPFRDIRDWVLHHHEQPDSGGYPSGLSATEIPFEARILAVAEAYEAMTNDRSYRPSLGPRGARSELRRGAGTKFDGEVVDALLAAIDGDSP